MAAVALAGWVVDAPAATFTVGSTTDAVDANVGDSVCASASAECTLRAAVQEANALADADTIVLPAGTYALTIPGANELSDAAGDLDIFYQLTIAGAGVASTIVDGGGFDGLIEVPNQTAFTIHDVTLQNTTGRGISVEWALDTEIRRCSIRRCTRAGVWVQEIMPASVVEIADSTIEENGCGIALSQYDTVGQAPTVLVTRCIVQGNHPDVLADEGGILAESTKLAVRDSIVRNNSGSLSGGGVTAQETDLTIERSSIVGNTGRIGGGLAVGLGSSAIIDSTIASNTATEAGGGIVSVGVALMMARSTVSDNSAPRAGGIWVADSVWMLINSTVSGNSADSAGGIDLARTMLGRAGTLNLRACTIASNTALDVGGLNVGSGASAGSAEIANTIIADNIGAPASPDIAGDVASLGYNLVEDPNGWTMSGDLTGNITGVDPVLGPLQDNGGFTFTHALLAGSPAIDAADPSGCADDAGAPLSTDQRGVPRALDGDGDGTPRCDIGAYESCGSDTDLDGVGDLCDCAPSDPGAWAIPAEPTLAVTRPAGATDARLDWTDVAADGGSATTYDVASDLLSVLRVARSATGACVATGLATPTWLDTRPLVADGFYYLVRGVNACGPPRARGWGRDSLGVERPACP